MIDPVEILDERREFHEARAKGLFSTDGPKLLLLSRYGTPRTVYEDKVGTSKQGPMSLPAWLGLKLEATVAELYTESTGRRVRRDARDHWAKGTDFPMGAHLDFRVVGEPRRLVEAKTRAYMKGWGEEGSKEIPPDVWVQVQHQMYVTGAERCDVAVLFGHHTFRVYEINRSDEFLDGYLTALSAFWNGHVLKKDPPPPSGKPQDTERVKAGHPTHDDTLRAATPEMEQLVRQYRQARFNRDQAEERKAELENQLKEHIGDAAGLTGSFGNITWKRTKDSTEVSWQLVADAYANVIDDLLEMANPGDDDEAVSRLRADLAVRETAVSLYTTVKPGYRRFHASFEEEA
jgi:predicted phage-related endonuclease